MATYSVSETTESMAKRIIKEHHKHLENANIAYVMKEYDPEGQRQQTKKGSGAGKVRKIIKVSCFNAPTQECTGLQFMLVVDQKLWDDIEPDQREAVMDNALAQCGFGADGAVKNDPDVTVFADVVARRGAFNGALVEFFDKTRELPLFQGLDEAGAQAQPIQ